MIGLCKMCIEFGSRLFDSVAQLVEQMTLNHWVVGSSPTGVTQCKALIFNGLQKPASRFLFAFPAVWKRIFPLARYAYGYTRNVLSLYKSPYHRDYYSILILYTV